MNPTPGLRIGLKFATLAGLTLLVAAQPPQVAYAQKTAAPRTFDELRERGPTGGVVDGREKGGTWRDFGACYDEHLGRRQPIAQHQQVH